MFKTEIMYINYCNEYNKNTIVLTINTYFDTIVVPERNLVRSTCKCRT